MSGTTLKENLDKMHRWTFGAEGEFGKDVARELVQQVSDVLHAARLVPQSNKDMLRAREAAVEAGIAELHKFEVADDEYWDEMRDTLRTAFRVGAPMLSPAPLTINREALKVVADAIRRNCTPPPEAYDAGGDVLIYAVADWVENPPGFAHLSAQTVEGEAESKITDEQVEAAAQSPCNGDLYEYPYTDDDRERYRGQARAALEAARGVQS